MTAEIVEDCATSTRWTVIVGIVGTVETWSCPITAGVDINSEIDRISGVSDRFISPGFAHLDAVVIYTAIFFN